MSARSRLAACAGGFILVAAAAFSGQAESPDSTQEAVFAGGCFWCMQPPFDELDGVVRTEVGFTGGYAENPSYREVVAGGTGHVEAVRVLYDPARIDYEELLAVFWRNIDPFDDAGQFCDRGDPYRAAVFADGQKQRQAATASKEQLEAAAGLEQPIVTAIRDAMPFYLAEEYHQDYYRKRPLRYHFYVTRCGREQRLNEVWAD